MAKTKWSFVGGHKKLFIRIPRKIWNEELANFSPHHSVANNATPSALTLPCLNLKISQQLPKITKKRARSPGTKNSKNSVEEEEKDTPWPPIRCKTPLYRFHPPGPNHAKNEISLEAPCLQRTCRSCMKRHPQLIDEPVSRPVSRPAIEPLSQVIDPQLLEWSPSKVYETETSKESGVSKGDEKRRINNLSVHGLLSPALQPVNAHTCITPYADSHILPSSALQVRYDVFLPIRQVNKVVSPPVSAKSRWRTEPRRRYTAVLKFRSQEGRKRFGEVMARYPARGILKLGSEDGRGVRGRARVGVETEGGGGGGEGGSRKVRKVRFRHRVRLVFGSVEGRRRFREVVGR
ncbi:hypothetical protein K505DRAFT_332378 [Melanomma pulvis-pyrius CBS 109.77]|uniref:Uncharacterized protein n=1 Tax=Melanomma pulvis-pyrius CBS 109.77 TaxID=1314802 RepID=A0A6A6XTA6_9PLEO|nr:hypothetical protein K505DRAFT_332378 [Melanomma pulvis-pyrius CBS 109.77]